MIARWKYVQESERKQVKKLEDTKILDTTGDIQKVLLQGIYKLRCFQKGCSSIRKAKYIEKAQKNES